MSRKSLPIYLSIFLLIFAGLVCGVLLVSSSSILVPPPTIAASARGSSTSALPASSPPATDPSQLSPTVHTSKPTPDLSRVSPAALAKALVEAPNLNYAVAATEQVSRINRTNLMLSGVQGAFQVLIIMVMTHLATA